jgi:hypothetical protein
MPLESVRDGGVDVGEVTKAPVKIAPVFLGNVVFVEILFQCRCGDAGRKNEDFGLRYRLVPSKTRNACFSIEYLPL